MPTLNEMILAPRADLEAIAHALNQMGPSRRIKECLSITPPAQRRLWSLTEGQAVQFDELVPPSMGLQPVRHYGRNTLPAFTRFEKRFRRPPPEAKAEDVLWGYNEGPTRPLVGPGYFITRKTAQDSRGAVVVDYYSVPPTTPEGWPPVRPNDTGISRFVYGFMHDYLRRVSPHVSIGRAYRKDRRTPNCFILCREY